MRMVARRMQSAKSVGMNFFRSDGGSCRSVRCRAAVPRLQAVQLDAAGVSTDFSLDQYQQDAQMRLRKTSILAKQGGKW